MKKINSKENEESYVYLHMKTANWRKLRILVYLYHKNAISIWKRQILNKICQNLKKMTDFTYIYKKNPKSEKDEAFLYISLWKWHSEEIWWKSFIFAYFYEKIIFRWKFKFWRKPCIFAYFYTKTTHSEESEAFIIFL